MTSPPLRCYRDAYMPKPLRWHIVRVRPQLFERLRRVAELDRRSATNMAEVLLEEAIRRRERQWQRERERRGS